MIFWGSGTGARSRDFAGSYVVVPFSTAAATAPRPEASRARRPRTVEGSFGSAAFTSTYRPCLTPQARGYLADLKSSGVCLQIGVAGDGPAIEDCIGDPVFDVLTLPFTLTSDWQARRRIRDAGPVVWLPRHRMWAIGRFDDVRAALRDGTRGLAAEIEDHQVLLGPEDLSQVVVAVDARPPARI